MTIEQYNPEVFSELKDFHIARENLPNSQQNLLKLGDEICKHSVHEKVGISLLHKHFPLESNERLVEEFGDNKFYIKPRTELDEANIIPYLWKSQFEPESGKSTWFPLEFMQVNQHMAKVQEITESVISNSNFLQELAAKLFELKLENDFGLAIIHRGAIKLGEGEIVVETTDETTRTLTCSATVLANIDETRLTQTLWTFAPNETLKGSGSCFGHDRCLHCVGHCLHCLNHG